MKIKNLLKYISDFDIFVILLLINLYVYDFIILDLILWLSYLTTKLIRFIILIWSVSTYEKQK